MVGWGDSIGELAAGLAEFAVEGTLVTVISPDRPLGLPDQPLRGCHFRHVEGSSTSFQSFHQAGLAECDSLLLGHTSASVLPVVAGVVSCHIMSWGHTSIPFCLTVLCAPAKLPIPTLAALLAALK